MVINIITAIVVTFIITLIACPIFIKRMRLLQYGQQIREDGPGRHSEKAGTPTMGGTVFILAAVLVSIPAGKFSPVLLTAVLVIVGCGLIGFFDDYQKVAHNRSLGLKARSKIAAQIVIALILIILLHLTGLYSTVLTIPFTMIVIDIGLLYPLLIFILITASTNSVNLTDGLDGLAAGVSAIGLIAYAYIASLSGLPELSVVAVSLAAACLGFLIYNRHPARLFMGDTGSLALGGAFAVMAVLTKTELLLIIIGLVFVVEALSVIAQVASFQLTGKRIFLMSPLHHHFELKGWSEWRVVTFFWVGGFLSAILGVIAYRA